MLQGLLANNRSVVCSLAKVSHGQKHPSVIKTQCLQALNQASTEPSVHPIPLHKFSSTLTRRLQQHLTRPGILSGTRLHYVKPLVRSFQLAALGSKQMMASRLTVSNETWSDSEACKSVLAISVPVIDISGRARSFYRNF